MKRPSRFGHEASVFDARWPAWDESLVVEDQVDVVIQVNGKTRPRVQVSREADE
jgi:leucyl-tRNA synthetase